MRPWPAVAGEIYYELTSGCDLKCSHCCGVFRNEITNINAEELLVFHKSWLPPEVRHVILTGGEPTLHPEFLRILEGVSATHTTTVTTNGFKWDATFWQHLLNKSPNVFLQISVDGATPETFNSIRGKGVFERVEMLMTQLSQADLGHRVGLSMTVTKQNINEVDAVLEKAQRLNLAQVYFPEFLPIGTAVANWLTLALSADAQIAFEDYLLSKYSNSDGKLRVISNRINRIATILLNGSADCFTSCTLKVNSAGSILPCPVSSGSQFELARLSSPNSLISFPSRLAGIRSRINPPVELNVSLSESKFCSFNIRFCEACGIIGPPSDERIEQCSEIYRHHLTSAISAME